MRSQMRERLEALLLAERDRTAADLHQVEQDEAEAQSVTGGGLPRTIWAHADAASDTQEEEADFMTATRASAHLAEIDDALRLLAADPEALGRCQRCRGNIARARLELVPWTRLCAACSLAEEGAAPA